MCGLEKAQIKPGFIMLHILMMGYFIAFGAGLAAILALLIHYFQLKKNWILLLSALVLLFTLRLAVNAVSVYRLLRVTFAFDWQTGVYLEISAAALFMIILPWFKRAYLTIKATFAEKFVFISLALFIIVVMVIVTVIPMQTPRDRWNILILLLNWSTLLSFLFSVIITVSLIKAARNKQLLVQLISFLILSPFLLLDSFYNTLFAYFKRLLPTVLAQASNLPAYLVMCALVLYFSLRSLFQVSLKPCNETEQLIDLSGLSLSEREQEVTTLILKGKTYAETAESLKISVQTVKSHLQNIFVKTGVRSKIALVRLIKDKGRC